MKSCEAVVEDWKAVSKSTRRAYSGKFIRRRRDWKRGRGSVQASLDVAERAQRFHLLRCKKRLAAAGEVQGQRLVRDATHHLDEAKGRATLAMVEERRGQLVTTDQVTADRN